MKGWVFCAKFWTGDSVSHPGIFEQTLITGPAMKLFTERKKQIIITLGIVCVNFFIDRLAKVIAASFLAGKEPLILLKRLMIFTYVENTGAFLGLGEGWNIFVKYCALLIVPLLVCAVMIVYLALREQSLFRIIAGSCIIGGGAGNLVDRLFNHFSVVDFMNFGIGPVRTGILNAADISVTFGAIALLLYELRRNAAARKTSG